MRWLTAPVEVLPNPGSVNERFLECQVGQDRIQKIRYYVSAEKVSEMLRAISSENLAEYDIDITVVFKYLNFP